MTMLCFGRATSKRRLTTLVVTLVTAIVVSESMASAQIRVSAVTPPRGVSDLSHAELPADTARQREQPRLQPIQESLRTIDYGAVGRQSVRGPFAQPAVSGRKRSVGRKILGAAIFATAGLFAGGYLGAVIEGDRCQCDDPGLQGALIGAPVGLVAGGILGALIF